MSNVRFLRRLAVIPVVIGLLSAQPTLAQITEEIDSSPAIPPGIIVYRHVCVDPDLAGTSSFSTSPLNLDWAAQTLPDTVLPVVTPPATSEQDDFLEVNLLRCRFNDERDGEIEYTLTNSDSGESYEQAFLQGDYMTQFLDIESGSYTITESAQSGVTTSAPFEYDADDPNPVLNVFIKTFIGEMDWTPPTEDPEDLGQINFIPYLCDPETMTSNAEWMDMTFAVIANGYQLNNGVQGWQRATPLSSPAALAECEFDSGQELVLEVYSVDETGEVEEGIPLYLTPDGRWTTDWIPMGDYAVRERTSMTTIGIIDLVAGHDITVRIAH